MSDDVSLPEPFQVVFSADQTTSTSCTTISITSDTELEGDQSFTVAITGVTDNTSCAVLGTASITTVTIIDDDGCEDTG